uniref:Protein kinase domain-containing protein n=1 Tax=Globisporangium ultimum (strain ATCC 200006 / CBS 805.95 / DAOM BR144) TaxID=431595 RepID=K3WDC6_GLOUD
MSDETLQGGVTANATKLHVSPPTSPSDSVSDSNAADASPKDLHLRRSSTSSSDTAENGAPVMPMSAQSQEAAHSQAKCGETVTVNTSANGTAATAVHIPKLDLQKLRSGERSTECASQQSAASSMASPSATIVYNTFSFEEVMSPRHHNGKRYLGGYLLHRISMAGGFLKSWKRKYFRLRDHGIMCFKNQDDSTPLFEIVFKAHSVLLLGKLNGDGSGNYNGSFANKTPKSANPYELPPTSSTAPKAKVNGSLLFILKHVEILGHETPTAKVEVPLYLKAEHSDEYLTWIECLRLKIEARKRALAQSTVHAVVSGSSDGRFNSHGDERLIRIGSDIGKGSDGAAVSDTASAKKKSGGVESQSSSPTSSSQALREEHSSSKSSDAKKEGTTSANETTTPVSADPPEFARFQNKYLIMKEIGEGSFSIVHKVVNRLTGQLCAVKCCKYSSALEEEVGIMRKLSHPNIVGIEGVYNQSAENNMCYVVMDYMEDGDLCDRLIKHQRLPESEVQMIISQVLQGLEYLHRHNILHRDIKPENILLHGDMVKIADFGLAKQLPNAASMLKRSCGTLEYAAPELLVGQPYGLKSDIFSLGVVLYVLLFGAFPFSIESAAALQCMERFPEGVDVRDMSCLSRENIQWRMVSPQAQDVILKMLAPREKDRVSARDLLVHPWFDPERSSSPVSLVAVQPRFRRDSNTWKLLEMNAVGHEVVRLEDCAVKGFTELMARGLEVTKYGNKGSTAPHVTTLVIDFPKQVITWTARANALGLKSSRQPSSSVDSSSISSGKQSSGRRIIRISDITEIRLGHATDAFRHAVGKGKDEVLPHELCLSIICSWRTLDIVAKAPSQREFLSKGLLRLINNGAATPSKTSPVKQIEK